MRKLAADFPHTEPPRHNVFMGGREPEWRDGSNDELVDAMAAAGMPPPLGSGRAFGDGQALPFVGLSSALRAADRHPRPPLASLLRHLFGSDHAEPLIRAGRW
jgi:hypothetical protein